MKLIFGLGNPGLRYKSTRHNVGFRVAERFAKLNKARIGRRGFGSRFEKLIVGGQEVVLIEPQGFMNNSGDVVREAAARFGAGTDDILVICDDVNLSLGVIRFRASGSAGGHKGLESVEASLRTDSFNRLRIGVGLEKGRLLRDYVLSGFSSGERRALKEVIDKAADAVSVWITRGIEAAMNEFNIKNKM